jgi:hypothetical protein
VTYLQLVNKVLRRLREKQVAVITSEYALMVGDMVNEAKDEVEAAWDWKALRTEITFSTVAGTTDYLLADTTEKTRLLYDKETGRAQVYNLTDGGAQMHEISLERARSDLATSPPRARPYTFSTLRSSSGLTLRISPAPDAVYSIKATVVVPQGALSSAATNLTVPSDPVWMLALAYATEERGSGMGARAEKLEQKARVKLAEAIIQDMEPGELTLRAE